MQNPLFDRYLTETRTRIGVSVIHDADAVRRVPRAIREGHAVGVSRRSGRGRARLHLGALLRALRQDAARARPCSPCASTRRSSSPRRCASRAARYTMYFEEVPVQRTGDREADVDAHRRGYTGTLERWVRRYPEQYFWHHRRWKHQRPGTPPELGDPS